MKVTFNIGLNNNPFNEAQIQQFLLASREYKLIRWIKDMGEYIDNPEPTFVCEIEFPHNVEPEILIRFTRNMCETYTQECIPFSCDIMDMLVFNPLYVGGRFKFDEKYFIRIKD